MFTNLRFKNYNLFMKSIHKVNSRIFASVSSPNLKILTNLLTPIGHIAYYKVSYKIPTKHNFIAKT